MSNEVTKKDLDAVKKDLAAAKKTIDSLDGQVSSLNTDMKQAKADISENWKVLYADVIEVLRRVQEVELKLKK